jgi:thiosulfate/3-mercaptopyruvate sulfurtransferase
MGFDSPLISTDRLAAELGAPDLVVLDCSVSMLRTADGAASYVPSRDEYEAAHVPGAAFADVIHALSARDARFPLMMPPAEELAAAFSRLGVGDDRRAVLYDRGDHMWAARAWWLLRAIGFDAAVVLDGGFRKWVAERRPVSSARVEPARVPLTARPRPHLVADRDGVLHALATGDARVVNALPAQRHAALRIAGSVNVPYDALVNPTTFTFRATQELADAFATAGVLPGERVIAYCGAGIAACNDALALTLLGRESAVYDGSLSEWTSDPALPVEHG